MSSMHLDHWIIQLMLPAFSGCNGSYNVQCTAKTKLKWDKATLFQKKSILTCLVFITLEVNSTFLYEIRNSKGACYFVFVRVGSSCFYGIYASP